MNVHRYGGIASAYILSTNSANRSHHQGISSALILSTILDLSKIEAGKLDLEVLDFELIPLVEGTAELLSEQARYKNIAVMTFIEPDLPK